MGLSSLELYLNGISLSVCFFGLVSSTQQNYSEALLCRRGCSFNCRVVFRRLDLPHGADALTCHLLRWWAQPQAWAAAGGRWAHWALVGRAARLVPVAAHSVRDGWVGEVGARRTPWGDRALF